MRNVSKTSTWVNRSSSLTSSTGISGAHALAQAILSGTPGAVERYLGFLKSGGSQYPLDTLKQAGVDLTTPEPVETTFGILAEMVDRLERLIGQRP